VCACGVAEKEGRLPYLGRVMHTKIREISAGVCAALKSSAGANILLKRSLQIECLYPYECFHMQINSAKAPPPPLRFIMCMHN